MMGKVDTGFRKQLWEGVVRKLLYVCMQRHFLVMKSNLEGIIERGGGVLFLVNLNDYLPTTTEHTFDIFHQIW